MAGKYCSKSKRKFSTAIVLAALLLMGMAVAVYAYYIHRTPRENYSLTSVEVSCETKELVSGNKKSDIQVSNTGEVPAYIRVRLVSFWQTPSGSIAGRASKTPKLDETLLGSGWIPDLENDTYYYSSPIKEKTSTPNLLKEGQCISLVTDADGYIQVVEILAEAIQAKPGAAVQTAWGVILNADGTIQSVS